MNAQLADLTNKAGAVFRSSIRDCFQKNPSKESFLRKDSETGCIITEDGAGQASVRKNWPSVESDKGQSYNECCWGHLYSPNQLAGANGYLEHQIRCFRSRVRKQSVAGL